jgi:hypothetical protein
MGMAGRQAGRQAGWWVTTAWGVWVKRLGVCLQGLVEPTKKAWAGWGGG